LEHLDNTSYKIKLIIERKIKIKRENEEQLFHVIFYVLLSREKIPIYRYKRHATQRIQPDRYNN